VLRGNLPVSEGHHGYAPDDRVFAASGQTDELCLMLGLPDPLDSTTAIVPRIVDKREGVLAFGAVHECSEKVSSGRLAVELLIEREVLAP
jgi:hypothetical protein